MADDDAIVATQLTPERGDRLLDSLETGAREDYDNMVQKIVLSQHPFAFACLWNVSTDVNLLVFFSLSLFGFEFCFTTSSW